MYLFLKRIGGNFIGSILGATSFMVVPYMVTMIVHGHGSQVMTAAYIPWIMWALIRLDEKSSLRNIGILSLLIGLQLQRAHVQIAYYTWLAAGLLVIMLIL